jgi:hypothetical protein
VVAIVHQEGEFHRRLTCALACGVCAMHLYEYLRPGDARLRVAVDLVTRLLAGQPNGMPPAEDENDRLFAAMWEVEKARVGEEGKKNRSVVLLAIDAVVLLCRAMLGRLEGEPQDDVDIEAFQACWYTAEAVELAFREERGAATSVIPTSVVIERYSSPGVETIVFPFTRIETDDYILLEAKYLNAEGKVPVGGPY